MSDRLQHLVILPHQVCGRRIMLERSHPEAQHQPLDTHAVGVQQQPVHPLRDRAADPGKIQHHERVPRFSSIRVAFEKCVSGTAQATGYRIVRNTRCGRRAAHLEPDHNFFTDAYRLDTLPKIRLSAKGSDPLKGLPGESQTLTCQFLPTILELCGKSPCSYPCAVRAMRPERRATDSRSPLMPSHDHANPPHLTRRGMIGQTVALAAAGAFTYLSPRRAVADDDRATPVALVGGAHIHAPGFVQQMADHDRIDSRYVWDPAPDTAQRRQQVIGGEIVDDPQVIWDDDEIEAVVILSQTNRHLHLISDAVAAGKHVFHDKPLGMDGDEATTLARRINDAGVIYQTGYFRRGEAPIQRIRQLIEDGAFGQITSIRTTMQHSGAIGGWFDDEWRWMADVEQAGVGGFGDLGTHALDLMLFLMDHADDRAVAATGHIGSALDRYEGADEYGEGLIRFASGAVGTVGAGWVAHANPNTLEISGTEAHARITEGQLHLRGPGVEDGHVTELPDPWPHSFQLYLQAITGEARAPLITADSAAYTNRVMTAIYHGAAEMNWVRLDH